MVAASRAFVCIRPQTFESESEAEVLRWIYTDRSDTLRNTSFGILSSDGKRKLSATGRTPSMVFSTPEAFEAALHRIAGEQKAASKKAIAALPVLADLRLALDVAAADLRPLAILYAPEKKALEKLQDRVAEQAWSEDFIGRLRYVVLDDAKDLEGFEEMNLEPGLSIVEAEAYGRGGQILAHVAAGTKGAALTKAFKTGLGATSAEAKRVRDHQRKARREGIEWETAIPVPETGRGR